MKKIFFTLTLVSLMGCGGSYPNTSHDLPAKVPIPSADKSQMLLKGITGYSPFPKASVTSVDVSILSMKDGTPTTRTFTGGKASEVLAVMLLNQPTEPDPMAVASAGTIVLHFRAHITDPDTLEQTRSFNILGEKLISDSAHQETYYYTTVEMTLEWLNALP